MKNHIAAALVIALAVVVGTTAVVAAPTPGRDDAFPHLDRLAAIDDDTTAPAVLAACKNVVTWVNAHTLDVLPVLGTLRVENAVVGLVMTVTGNSEV